MAQGQSPGRCGSDFVVLCCLWLVARHLPHVLSDSALTGSVAFELPVALVLQPQVQGGKSRALPVFSLVASRDAHWLGHRRYSSSPPTRSETMLAHSFLSLIQNFLLSLCYPVCQKLLQ